MTWGPSKQGGLNDEWPTLPQVPFGQQVKDEADRRFDADLAEWLSAVEQESDTVS